MLHDLDFADLKDNFQHRTYNFEGYKKRLELSNPRLLNWIGSINYSGYIREQCLQYLIDNYQLGDENRILLRLEDWVDNIYHLALEWTRKNFCKLSLEQLNRNQKLILYLTIKQRLQNSEAIEIINSCLIEKSKNLEPRLFYTLNSNFRKYLYLIAISESSILRSLLSTDKDPTNRLLLLKLFKFYQLTTQEIAFLKQDKCSLVRSRFIYYQIKHNIQPTKQEWKALALDKNQGIREIAAYYLKRDFEIDVYTIYQQRTDDKFYYIADFARPEDIKFFLAGLQHNNKQVKLLCLKAICRIDPNYLKQLNLRQLILENNKFKKVILGSLGSILTLTELETYQQLFLLTSKGELSYLSLLSKKSYWHCLDYALNLLVQNSTEEIINFVWKIYIQKSSFSQAINPELKTKIISKMSYLQNNPNYKVQKLCQELKFIIKYV